MLNILTMKRQQETNAMTIANVVALGAAAIGAGVLLILNVQPRLLLHFLGIMLIQTVLFTFRRENAGNIPKSNSTIQVQVMSVC